MEQEIIMSEKSENFLINPQVNTSNSPEQADIYELAKRLIEEVNNNNPQLTEIEEFTEIQFLGEGGFGKVYLARHQSTGEQVAIKVIQPEFVGEDKFEKRFQREMQNITLLKHPNLVKMRYSDLWEGKLFYVMEYCNGGSLTDLLKKSGGMLPLERALQITFQALDGLDYLHNVEIPNTTTRNAKGLVHRDIKPGNILLSQIDGIETVKIADYGLAKAFDLAGLSHITSNKKSGDKILAIGTLGFMPMQQIFDSKYVKPEVDIWAMAASLYQMLTRTTPRDFPQNSDIWEVVSTTQPTPIRDRNNSIPEQVAKVIDSALKDDESELHFKTAVEFKQALMTCYGNTISL